jgi:hypothetical protein
VRFYGADQGTGAPVFSSMAVDLTITNLLPLFAGRSVRLLPEPSPVEALAAAQRSLIRSGRYRRPYYWAAYVVSGSGCLTCATTR